MTVRSQTSRDDIEEFEPAAVSGDEAERRGER
jgi:hypothetical protein